MSKPNSKKEDEGNKTFVDRWGQPIEPLGYICDNEGNVYMVNSHFQAVPQDDAAPAVALQELMKKTTVRVLKPEEVLKYTKKETKDLKPAQAPIAAPPGSVPVHDPDEAATLALALQAIPDVSLAAELRRRGYFVTAVKPALIEL